jgi:hypothetical protein
MSLLDTAASLITVIPWALSVFGNLGSPFREITEFLSFFIFIWMILLIRLRGITISGNYRLRNHTKDLDLKLSLLKSSGGEEIQFTISQNTAHIKSFFCQILVFLGFKLLVVVKATKGLSINYDRDRTDFYELSRTGNYLILGTDADIDARRKILISAMSEDNTNHDGRGSIDIDLYISYPNSVLRWICMNLIGARGSISIDII